MLKTSYLILDLGQNASVKAIKSQYQQLAKQFHPDKNPDNCLAEEKFKLIFRAYKIALEDAQKREEVEIDNPDDQLPLVENNSDIKRSEFCRRRYRLTPSHRKFHSKMESEYIGTIAKFVV